MATVVLLGCDVSLLFAAENNNQPQAGAASTSDNPQLQKLQAQIDALQKPADSTPAQQTQQNVTTPANTAAAAAPVASLPSLEGPQLPSQPVNPNPIQPAYQPPSADSSAGNAGGPSAGAGLPQASAVPNGLNGNNVNQAQNQTADVKVTDKDVNDVAFNNMVQNSLPMTPEQIQKLRSAYMASQFAAASVPGTPPRPTATSVFADLSPGSTPPVVRLGQGFVSSLVFVDTTGAPWPIESYDVGNPSAFNIQWDKVSNTLMIQSTVLYTYGNLAIKLKGLNTPVMITLIPGQKAIDYRVDIRVPGYGPSARPFTANTLPAGANPDLLNILDGVPPPNSTTLKVEGGNCQAWLSNQKMYVRTRLSVLSPGWSATLSSGDGMHAYQMQPTPMLLVSQNGQVIQLKVEGF